jgi:two-component system phosphate regulon response regulator PhoB
MLPGVDGLEVCRTLKQEKSTRSIPIVMLTAKSEDSDVVSGLEVGADDYVTKPFSPRVLVARVRAVLRRENHREEKEVPSNIRVHQIEIDVPRHEVKCRGRVVDLSATEFGILMLLSGNPGWVYSRRKIIALVKGDDYPVTDRAVDVQILGLRKKLGECGDLIETVRGYGYRLKDSDS